jgi:hypothetical protein
MAEGKVIGKLTNIVNFSTDKASLNKVLADIKKVKDAMKAAMSPITAARNSTKLDPALKRQREINKAHTQAIIEDRKRSLNDQKQFNKMWDKEMNRIYNERRDDVLKRHNNARKERRARWKQEARDLKEMNRLHGQALAENMKRDQKIQNLYDRRRQAVLSARSSATSKRIARREREQSRASREQGSINNRNMRMDRRAQATQEWFGSTFGRGGQRKAASLYGDLRSGKINAEQYSTRLRSLRADLYRTQRAQRSFNQSIHDMRGAFVQATASYTAFAGLMGISNIGKQYEAQKAQMLVATGSKEKAASQLDYLRSETYRLGLGREQASQGYSQIAMAGQKDIGVGGVNKVFSGLSELATLLNFY